MLPPEELQTPIFSRTLRGYNPEEVEQHISFISSQFNDLYESHEALKRKYNALVVQYKRLKKDEDAIKAALLSAQNASSLLINETCERSELMLKNTKEQCAEILKEYENKVKYQQYILSKLSDQAANFKSELFKRYRTHIQVIEEINSEALSSEDWKMSEEQFYDSIQSYVDSKDKEFYENNNVKPNADISSEENLKNIDETVNEMINNEKVYLDVIDDEQETEIDVKKLLIEEDDNNLGGSEQSVYDDSASNVTSPTEEKSVSPSAFDYDNDDYEEETEKVVIGSDSTANESEVIDSVNESESFDNSPDNDNTYSDSIEENLNISEDIEDNADSISDLDSEIQPENNDDMINELSRLFSAENVDIDDIKKAAQKKKELSESEHDELDDEILRLLNDIANDTDKD